MSVSEGQNTSLYENNSTNDHAILLPIPSVVRIPFRIASAISPKLGGDLGRRIFSARRLHATHQSSESILPARKNTSCP